MVAVCIFRRLWGARATGRRQPRGSRQAGLTLVEILITLVLLSVLVLGISGLWSYVNADFLALTIRQKAVFVLNGEMERLSALYRFEPNFVNDAVDSDGYDNPVPGGGGTVTRKIYPTPGVAAVAVVNSIVTQQDAVFNCGDATCAGNVFHAANGVGTADDRNYVWIDQSRNIVGELSWRVQNPPDPLGVSGVQPTNCSDGVNPGNGTTQGSGPNTTKACQELTVYLRFPFRYQNATTPNAAAGFGKVETMSLITIVGRRP